MIYATMMFCILFIFTLIPCLTFASYAAVCDDKSIYENIKTEDALCKPIGYTQVAKSKVSVYQTHDLELDSNICLCESFKITQFCKSNILWSVDRWDHSTPTSVQTTECIQQCRMSINVKKSLDNTILEPIQCPWWSSAQNTTISLKTTIHSGFYNYLTRIVTITKPALVRCTISRYHTCSLDIGKIVVLDPKDLESHCHGDVTTHEAIITTVTKSQFEIMIPEKEWVLTISHPCITTLCDFRGIATLEGKMIFSEFFNSSLVPCASPAHFGATGSLLAFEEYNSEKAIYNDMHQKGLLCELAKGLLALGLKLNQPVDRGILNLMTEMSGYARLYKVVNGRLMAKRCNVTWIRSYTQLCISVWRADTTLGAFYAGADQHYLTPVRPPCAAVERFTILPGNFLIIGSMKNKAVSLGVLHKNNILGITQDLDDHINNNLGYPLESRGDVISERYNYDDKFSLHFPHIKIGVTVSLAAIFLFSAIAVFFFLKTCTKRRRRGRELPPNYHEVIESVPLTRVNRV